MRNLIKRIIISSINNLFRNQPDVLKHTSETGMTEWNLGHHLANEIAKYIFWLDVDIDVTKRNYDNKRPDIIFHKRNVIALNLLVIELKTSGNAGYQDDIKKIKEVWVDSELQYRFGAAILIIDKDNFEVCIIDRVKNTIEPIIDVQDNLKIPKVDKKAMSKIQNFIVPILAKKETEEDTTIEENKIDRMVYELYDLTEEEIKIVENSITN